MLLFVKWLWVFGNGGAYQGLHYNFERDGLCFELQFHTEKSIEIKMKNHYDYEVSRSVAVSNELKSLVEKWMMRNWIGFLPPDLFDIINNYP